MVSARAAAFGEYPTSAAARSTRSRVPGRTLSGAAKVRETDETETPASLATSLIVTTTTRFFHTRTWRLRLRISQETVSERCQELSV
ncbi:hypothetical protein Hesp01_53490 [Herbidospora sp. NBRC 101105]|nr:hypothetical protein Hesp01_53490 [Herbidospora sp. NBRC 101105]